MLAPHISGGLVFELASIVSCVTNALVGPHPSRRVRYAALAAPGRWNSFEERYDLADCPIWLPSSAENVASGTPRKASPS